MLYLFRWMVGLWVRSDSEDGEGGGNQCSDFSTMMNRHAAFGQRLSSRG